MGRDDVARVAFAGPDQAARSIDSASTPAHVAGMNLLLPQTRTGTVHSATPVNIHGDRFVDVAVALDGEAGPPTVGRVGATECPDALAPGERVNARFVMGVMVRVARERA